MSSNASASIAAAARWQPWELALLAALALSWFAAGEQHSLLANEIAIFALFALSLDLILGYAGIISLGHAAFFGVGAYAAALFAKHVMPDPLVGMAVAIAAAALLGALSSVLVMRGSDLARLMITLGVAAILYELANKLEFTGGADGLQGVTIGPLLGRFEFDLYGRTAFAYSLVLLVIGLLIARRIVASPFGWSLRAIRDNRLRAAAIGLNVDLRLGAVYTIAAAMAGAAGALLAQTTGFASLDVLDFHRSADVMLMLIIGGTGWLWGGVLGAIGFKLMHSLLSAWTPQYWTFWLGLFLVVLVMVGRDRFFRPWTWLARAVMTHRPRNPQPGEALRRLRGHQRRLAEGREGRAPGADRPERRRQDHADQPAHRRAGADLGHASIARRARTSPQLPSHQRVRRGIVRTFQINQLFNELTPLQSLALTVSQPARHQPALVAAARPRPARGRALRRSCCKQFHLDDVMDQQVAHLAYGKRRQLEIATALACAPRVLLLDEPVAGVPEGERQEIFDIVNALPAEVTVLLIEHDMDLVFNFARTVSVLVNGALFAEGDVTQHRQRPAREVGLPRGGHAAWLSCCVSKA